MRHLYEKEFLSETSNAVRVIMYIEISREADFSKQSASADVETTPTLLDLRALLESVSFLFHITAFGVKKESHLVSAQKALATMQSHTPAICPPPATAANAASSSNATPPISDANEQPCAAAATFTRYCTALYAMTMGDMHSAAMHLRTGLSALQTLQTSRSGTDINKGVLDRASCSVTVGQTPSTSSCVLASVMACHHLSTPVF